VQKVEPYDLIGVGIGPFNLSLAALADSVDGLNARFFDAKPAFSWHPGLMIDGAQLQVSFLADLVSLIDPTSRWSFLSYLKECDRLFRFYFHEKFHISRREYSNYCRWVADSLMSCSFGTTVENVTWRDDEQVFVVSVTDVKSQQVSTVLARNVVMGVGTQPSVPSSLQPLLGKRVFHVADYLDNRSNLRDASDVAVVGSGQSGAEVFLDLLRTQDESKTVRWLTRTSAFAPMEYSKLGLEHFTPDYIDYFRKLDAATRTRLLREQWQLYKGISTDTIADIYEVLYERSVDGDEFNALLMPNVEVRSGAIGVDGRVVLQCQQSQQQREFDVAADYVVLATGFAASPSPASLTGISTRIALDDDGRFQIDGDYRVKLDDSISGGLYVQNAEMHTHGVGAPDLGLGAYRSACILNAVTQREIFATKPRTAFTTFGVD
jgi:lysine N6-hydroxylase